MPRQKRTNRARRVRLLEPGALPVGVKAELPEHARRLQARPLTKADIRGAVQRSFERALLQLDQAIDEHRAIAEIDLRHREAVRAAGRYLLLAHGNDVRSGHGASDSDGDADLRLGRLLLSHAGSRA